MSVKGGVVRDKWLSRRKKELFIPNNKDWHTLRLWNPSRLSAIGTKVYLDGEQLHGVQYVDFHVGVDDPIPKAEIGIIVRPDTVFECGEVAVRREEDEPGRTD